METEAFFIVGCKWVGRRCSNTLAEARSYWTGYQWGAKCVARPYITEQDANEDREKARRHSSFWNRMLTSITKEVVGYNIHNPNKCKEAMQFD